MKTVAVSGGFDPLHYGHLQMFEAAKKLGDYLVVILNGDSWLMRKKGFVFMNSLQRAAIIGALKCVDQVYIHDSEEDDVCQALNKLNVDIFANGGDRKSDNTPEVQYCDHKGIQMAFNVGGGKIESSSEMVDRAKMRAYKKPWGEYKLLDGSLERNFALKTLTFKPHHMTSLQTHKHREEYWMLVEGEAWCNVDGHERPMRPFEVVTVGRGVKHRIIGGAIGATIVEVIRGEYDESDIIRYEDKYGRV